uniref:AGC-kinase C-terminal domain-containing protein n=1 Tax=Steinernema glaseri TaxID=37863 RepID=A0A1I7Y0Y6_9BILA
MPSYDNSCVLYEEISLRRDDLSEFEWSDHGGESDEVRSEYCWDGMDVAEPPKPPQVVRSEYAMDFDKRV